MKPYLMLSAAGITCLSFGMTANALAEAPVVNVATSYTVLEESPFYSNDTLIIPRISQADEPVAYQNVVLEKTERGDWQLKRATESHLLNVIDRADLIQVDAFPVQAYLKIIGSFTNGCGAVGDVVTEVSGNSINISVYSEPYEATLVACTMAMVPFNHVVPLPVYGLQAGEYQYSVNGTFSGSFTLDKDNVFEPEVYESYPEGVQVCTSGDTTCSARENQSYDQTIKGE
ncbi:hypothetical protein [Oceanospirillum sediminis]|uniref:Uncharacterized protein n=1 Tax=Oceanospirillum sediminis TaxID=2760088 RepID=A0A839IRE7_9GAMM|nr:hypothetical protein [Oceanospirillum sediminis]MBB1487244.1 hypothetical protein [Oceanospirillum sediminis]